MWNIKKRKCIFTKLIVDCIKNALWRLYSICLMIVNKINISKCAIKLIHAQINSVWLALIKINDFGDNFFIPFVSLFCYRSCFFANNYFVIYNHIQLWHIFYNKNSTWGDWSTHPIVLHQRKILIRGQHNLFRLLSELLGHNYDVIK